MLTQLSQLRATFLLAFCVGSLTGCPSDSKPDTATRGAGSGASAGSMSMMATCGAGMAQQPDMGHCTAKQIQDYTACMNSACESTFETCYGAGYKSGAFGGVCKSYLECASGCGCSNTTCVQKCSGASECGQCFIDHPCGTDCALKLSCNAMAVGKTCGDLANCCSTLPNAEQKSNCQQIVTQGRMLGASGDALCNSTFQLFTSCK